MELKVGEIVKIRGFLSMARAGTLIPKNMWTTPLMEYPDGVQYEATSLRRVAGKTAKVMSIDIISNGDTHYTVQITENNRTSTIRLGDYLIERKLLYLIKCEVSDADRQNHKYKTKETERKNRQALNKRVAGQFNLKPKGGK